MAQPSQSDDRTYLCVADVLVTGTIQEQPVTNLQNALRRSRASKKAQHRGSDPDHTRKVRGQHYRSVLAGRLGRTAEEAELLALPGHQVNGSGLDGCHHWNAG